MSDNVDLYPLVEQQVRTSHANGARDISFLALVNMHLRHRWLLVLLPTALLAVVVVLSVLHDRTYSSVASIVPEHAASSALSGLAGMASQFGVAIAQNEPSESPAFYAQLLTSQALLANLLDEPYAVTIDGRNVQRTLPELLRVERRSAAELQEATIRKFAKRLTVAKDRETGIVTFAVRTEWPTVSRELAQRLVALLNTFNVERRRTRATAERTFIEQRLKTAAGELRAAEAQEESFLQRNRQFTGSPHLQFQHDRLQRAVAMRQSVYTSLAEAYEKARVEEVRTVPVITVVQPPTLPVRPNPRGTLTYGVLALIVGLITAWLIALAHELSRHGRSPEVADFREYEALRRATLQDIRHPFRGLRRAIAGK